MLRKLLVEERLLDSMLLEPCHSGGRADSRQRGLFHGIRSCRCKFRAEIVQQREIWSRPPGSGRWIRWAVAEVESAGQQMQGYWRWQPVPAKRSSCG